MTGTPTPDGGFEDRFLIGIGASLFFEPYTEPRGLGGAITAGAQSVVESLRQNLRGIGAIITGQIGSCNLQGVIRIAEVSGEAAERGPDYFISIIAGLSLMIGLVNLLPIPVLDGGHLVFYAYEAVTGRKPSDKALRFLMTLGLTLVLGLMAFAIFNDLGGETRLLSSAAATSGLTIIGVAILLSPVLVRTWRDFGKAR